MAIPEVRYSYPPTLRASYNEGKLFNAWCKRYKGHYLFCDKMFLSHQIPHSGPLKNTFFFHELFIGTKYLDAGYEVLFFYRQVEDQASYRKASEVLGSSAAEFIAPNAEKGWPSP